MTDFAERVFTAQPGRTHLFSVGQAGFILKSRAGQTMAWDLYLSDVGERLEGHDGFKRLLPKILLPSELQFDTVIASHPHFDHFDPDSIPLLLSNPNTKLYASLECRKLTDRLFMQNCKTVYMAPGETYYEGDFTFHFVSCDHGALAPDAVGAIISVDGKNIFFAGDTCLRLDRTEEYLSFGAIDILIAPINGAYGNLNEHDCVCLSKALSPSLTIPCHYGMFASHGGNPGLFRKYMQEECPENQYLLMRMGEDYTW